jgi:hypothetical protein
VTTRGSSPSTNCRVNQVKGSSHGGEIDREGIAMNAYRYQPRHAAWLRTDEMSSTAQGSALAVIDRDEVSAPVEPGIDSE